LLGHVGDDAAYGQIVDLRSNGVNNLRRGLSCARVRFDVVKAPEDFDGRIAFNAILFAKIALSCAVDLGQRDVLLLQRCRGLFVLWSKGFAVSAPGGKELCEDEIVVFDEVLEVIGMEIVYIAGRGQASKGKADRSQRGE
jgi:hypothetical protein